MRRAPLDFVIIGAQRGGSTHVASMLGRHPEVALCPDEVPYFEDPFYDSSSAGELARVFRKAQPGQRRGMHRPEYLAKPECAPRIRSDAPDARVIAVLRDPVARAVSAYHWYVQFGLLPVVPVEEGLARLLDGWRLEAYPRAGDILEYGRYGSHLTRYFELFGSGRVMVLRFDQLGDPAAVSELCRFVGIDPAIPLAPGRGRTNAGVYDMRRLRWLRLRRNLAFSWEGQRRYEYRPRRLRRPARSALAAAVVAFDRAVLAPFLGDGSARISPRLEDRLARFYSDDVAALEQLLGWSPTGWARSNAL